jgi:hypothetical protein
MGDEDKGSTCVLWLGGCRFAPEEQTIRHERCMEAERQGQRDLPSSQGEGRQGLGLLLFYSSFVGSDVGMAWHVTGRRETDPLLLYSFVSLSLVTSSPVQLHPQIQSCSTFF